ncbi:MAG: DUF3108 domain-containing protein [Candidatus Cloacimonetes bacterium]|nr:DUF3108 domain-containing protein [Candidatus Cloacimonadota bacterium]
MKRILIAILVFYIGVAWAYKNNEKLTFETKYGIISAAEAVLEVNEVAYTDSSNALRISAKTKTYPFFDSIFKVRDEIYSYIDPTTKLPYEFIKNLKEGNYRQKREHSFDRKNLTTLYRRWSFKTEKWREKVLEIPADTYDMFSAFYWTREQNLTPGDTLSLSVTSDGTTAPIKIIVHKREKIDTLFGKRNCIMIEPVVDGETIFANSGRVFIWLTDDEQKIPVLLESKIVFGSFKAILIKAENVSTPKK